MKIKHVYGNVLRLDIPLTIKIRTMEDGVPTEREEPFYPDVSKGCAVILGSSYNRKIQYDATVSGNVAHIEDDGVICIGTYKVTVKCYDEQGNPYRYMVRDIVEICDATKDAGIEAGVEFNAETYTLDGAVFVSYGVEQVQSDWAETDPEEKSFIKNKPDLSVYATKEELENVESEIPVLPENLVTDANYVHTDNNYTNEDKQKLAGLENYDDTELRQSVEGLDESKVDKVAGKGLSTNDFTNEDKSKLDSALQSETDPTVPSWAKQPSKPSYSAQEVGALPNSTKYGSTIDLAMNSTTYVLTLSLKDQDGTVLNTKTVDLPIESVVVNGRYDAANKKIVLTLQSGSTIDVPVGDLIAGLQTEITSVNMLDADLVDDTNSTHKFVTAQEKQTWNNKQKAIAEGRGITITTGANADTIAFNLPIYAGSGTDSIMEGYGTTASGNYSHAEGVLTKSNGDYSHAEGQLTIAYNNGEHASGQFNKSNKASTAFGDGGNTLFSVGNGTGTSARHNAFEIRQNGDIYLTLGGQDVKLQDTLGNKVDKTTTVNGHALSGNVTVTKSDVGLGNVGNYKAVSTEASQGLSDTEKSYARANIGLNHVDNTYDEDKDVLSAKTLKPIADIEDYGVGVTVGDLKNIIFYETELFSGIPFGSYVLVSGDFIDNFNDDDHTVQDYGGELAIITFIGGETAMHPLWLVTLNSEYSENIGVIEQYGMGVGLRWLAHADDIPNVPSWALQSSKPTYTASEVGAVSTEANQGLTSTEQSNARANIGAGTSNFSGSYNDLSDKPTIPSALSQLSEDTTHRTVSDTEKTTWGNKQETLVSGTNIKTINNESILGSGNITIQGGGSAYVPTLNSAPTSSTTTYTKDGSTVDFEIGQFCRTLNNGSYDFYQLYDLQEVNNVKTATWEKVVEESEVGGKEDVTTIVAPVNQTDTTLPITTLTCEVGKYYRIDVAVDTLGVTLPAMTDLTTVRTVVIYLTAGTTPAVTISSADSKDVYYQDGFEIEAGSTYEINALFNGAAWIVAAVKINTSNS